MKKIMRSKITKATAFILLIACAVSFGFFMLNIIDYYENKEFNYSVTEKFDTSACIRDKYWEAIDSLKYATWEEIEAKLKTIPWIQYYIVGDGVVLSNIIESADPQDVIYFMLFDMYQSEEAREREARAAQNTAQLTSEVLTEAAADETQIEYITNEDGTFDVLTEDAEIDYVMNGDGTFSSGGETESAYIVQSKEDDDGIMLVVKRFDGNERHITKSPYAAFNSIKEAHVGMCGEKYTELYVQWVHIRDKVRAYIIILTSLILAALVLFIYLLAVCGRKPNDEEVHMLAIDRIFEEILLTAAFFICLGFGAGCMVSVEEVSYYSSDMFIMSILMSVCTAGFTATLTIAMQSVFRNIKNKTFCDRSIIIRVCRLFIGLIRKACKELKTAVSYFCGGKISRYILGALVIYSLALGTLGRNFLFFIVLLAAGCVFLYRYITQLDKIKEGIFQIRNGNTDYRITDCTNKALADTAEALNNINEGVKIGVEREVKAQRMKSELITNVSHDLKTPLTSIITYSDLLSSMELEPKEANDYAAIIKQKGYRLKKLTADLFDISKAESGNETVVFEKLDARLLLKQTLAELNHEIEGSGLLFVEKIPEKEIFVRADGKKLSRVFENLVVNAVKYSMKGTRVYINAEEAGENIRIEFKNISNTPLNFDPNEITERFVRGDKNRSTEGSGLGLAIAKSYTELCGGRFEISVDGDLFKACIELKKG